MITDVLEEIKQAAGSNLKKSIIAEHSDSEIFRRVLTYSFDPFVVFNVVKIPKVKALDRSVSMSERERWEVFFKAIDTCASREVTGNAAIELIRAAFCVVKPEEEMWMRRILKKHLAIGASVKTINSVIPGLIPTFEVALAQKFETKRLVGRETVFVEPKLDGIRCFAIVEKGDVKLYARSGKVISNFDTTIGPELLKLGDGCYDGELMGTDFIALMRQAYRKEDKDVTGTYLCLFDYLPIEEWQSKESVMSCHDRFETLLDKLSDSSVNLSLVQPVDRFEIDADYDQIKEQHDEYVRDGFEGAMVKFCDAPYKFGRGYEVMKLKAFHDVDLPIDGLLEGTGKHEGKLGSVVVNFNGVDVQVGSGFSDELRTAIWNDQASYIGRMIEVRYQEVTPDGSLRFPTFVCFRNDR